MGGGVLQRSQSKTADLLTKWTPEYALCLLIMTSFDSVVKRLFFLFGPILLLKPLSGGYLRVNFWGANFRIVSSFSFVAPLKLFLHLLPCFPVATYEFHGEKNKVIF